MSLFCFSPNALIELDRITDNRASEAHELVVRHAPMLGSVGIELDNTSLPRFEPNPHRLGDDKIVMSSASKPYADLFAKQPEPDQDTPTKAEEILSPFKEQLPVEDGRFRTDHLVIILMLREYSRAYDASGSSIQISQSHKHNMNLFVQKILPSVYGVGDQRHRY